jgi:hypothetical protein
MLVLLVVLVTVAVRLAGMVLVIGDRLGGGHSEYRQYQNSCQFHDSSPCVAFDAGDHSTRP